MRDAQGPDAVILSSRRVAGGVEVVAAIDYDGEDAATEQLAQCAGAAGLAAMFLMARPSRAMAAARTSARAARAQQTARAQQAAQYVAHAADARSQPAIDYSRAAERHATDLARFELADANSDVNEELRSLRRMLETQLATLAWNDLARRSPIQTELLKQLTQLGLAQDLATELVTQLPTSPRTGRSASPGAGAAGAPHRNDRRALDGRRWRRRPGRRDRRRQDHVDRQARRALGAASWPARHRADHRRTPCASARRNRFIRSAACSVCRPMRSTAPLNCRACSNISHDKRLVLIDTAGLSPRDPRLERGTCRRSPPRAQRMETTLVLSAAAQAGAIEEAVQRFAAAQPTTCVLTKLDEATSLGGAISTLIRSRLPVTYVSEGQRVPEDLAPARAHQLIARAVDLSRKSGASADEDLLRRRFGSGGARHRMNQTTYSSLIFDLKSNSRSIYGIHSIDRSAARRAIPGRCR